MIVDLWQDLSFGVRMLMKSPDGALARRHHGRIRHWGEYCDIQRD